MILSKEVKNLPGSKVETVIRVGKDFVKGKYNEVLKEYSGKLKIQGFRQGKIPLSIIESKYSENLKSAVMQEIIHKSLEEFFKEAEKKPLNYASPRITDEKLDLDLSSDFQYTVVYDTYPEFEVPKLDELSIEVKEVLVNDSDIEDELKNLQEQNAMIIEDKSGTVKKGSIVTVDFVELGNDDNDLEATRRQDFVFTVGESNNYYDFDKDIVKMKKDEEKIIAKEYKDDYKFKDLAGLTKKLKVKIKDIKIKDIPALDDEFAKDINDSFSTLYDLRTHVKGNISKFIEEKQKEIKTQKLFSELSKKVYIDIPESMIEAEIENTFHNVARQNKMTIEEFKKAFSFSKDMVNDKFRNEIISKLKSKLILQKLVDSDPIEITDTDVEAELIKQTENTKMEYEEVKKFYEEKNLLEFLKDEIKKQKIKFKFLEKIKEIKGKEILFKEFLEYELDENE